MKKLLFTEKNVYWIEGENVVETYLADELPNINDCTSSHAIVFKDGALLHTELRKGERSARMLDIPGGHLDEGETLEHAVVRETFEETGVYIKVIKLVGYIKVTVISPKPEGYRYPYPVSYMAFYLCEVVEETPFDGNEDTHGRVWLMPLEFEKSEWCRSNKKLLEEIL